MLFHGRRGDVYDGAAGAVGVRLDHGGVAPERTGGGLAAGEGALVHDGLQAQPGRLGEHVRKPAVALLQALSSRSLGGEVHMRGARVSVEVVRHGHMLAQVERHELHAAISSSSRAAIGGAPR